MSDRAIMKRKLRMKHLLLAAMAFAVPIRIPIGSVWGLGVRPLEVVTIVGLALLAVRTSVTRGRMSIDKGTLSVLFCLIVSVLPSVFGTYSLQMTGESILRLLLGTGLVVVIVSFSDTLEDMSSLELGTVAATVLSLILSLIGYLQASRGAGSQFVEVTGGRLRLEGLFDDPNYFASYLAMLVAYAWACIIVAPRMLSWWLAVFLAASIALGLTLSRGSFVAAAAAVLAVSLVHRGRVARGALRRGLMAVTLLAAIAVVFAAILPQAVVTIVARVEAITDRDVRYYVWADALEIFANHNPLTGVGVGAFQTAHERYGQQRAWTPYSNKTAHNTYLNALVSGGVLHFLAVVGLFYFVFLRAWRSVIRSSGLHMLARMSLGGFGMFAALAVSGLSLTMLEARHLWFVVAIVFATAKVARVMGPIRHA